MDTPVKIKENTIKRVDMLAASRQSLFKTRQEVVNRLLRLALDYTDTYGYGSLVTSIERPKVEMVQASDKRA